MNQYFVNGGPMMWPLLVLSLITLAITLDKLVRFFIFAFRSRQSVRNEFISLAESNGITEALNYEKIPKDIATSLLKSNLSKANGLFKFELALQERLNYLARYSRWYDVVIYLAPIFGILGTVVGVIVSFNIAGDMNLMDPSIAMKGIAQAFISTAAGLIVAVMAYIPSSFFDNIIDSETQKLNVYLMAVQKVVGVSDDA